MTNIIKFSIAPREHAPDRAYLIMECDRNKEGVCRFGLWQKPANGASWAWDGNIDKPTITPSIACNGGCGRHFTITAGEVR